MSQENGGAKKSNLHFFRNKVIQQDYNNLDVKNEGITAKRDIFQNQLQGLQQSLTVYGGDMSSDGQIASEEINLTDNVANLMTKMGDEGGNQ